MVVAVLLDEVFCFLRVGRTPFLAVGCLYLWEFLGEPAPRGSIACSDEAKSCP